MAELNFQKLKLAQKVPHALLLIGTPVVNLLDKALQMATTLLCTKENAPCKTCQSCYLMQQQTHPDYCTVHPDKEGGIIKIEQIRAIQELAYITPQLAKKRVICLYPAEKMTISAANALLKLLEEPPASVHFILIAEQISTIPATILSRCQQWRLTHSMVAAKDYLSLGEAYPLDSERGQLYARLLEVLADLKAVVEQTKSPCSIAEKWAAFPLNEIVWLLYLIQAQWIECKLLARRSNAPWADTLFSLAQQFSTIHLFKQLDQLQELSRKNQQAIAINPTLALESFLWGYLPS